MKAILRVLIVEDCEDDATLLVQELHRGNFDVLHLQVQTGEAMRAALACQTWDIVVSDYSLPQFSGIQALSLLRATGLDVPLIIVSGTIGEETAVDALKAGACDFILKDRLARLNSAIEREMRDVAARQAKRALEATLAETKARMHFALTAASVGIWESDLAANHITWSDVLQQLHGLPVGGFDGTPAAFLACIHPADRPAVLASLSPTTRDQSDSHVEYRTTWPSGSTHWIALRGRTFYNETGQPVRAAGVGMDVTAEKSVAARAVRELADLQLFEDLLRQKNAELDDASRMKAAFLANMSHELRTPLNAIIGFSEVLRDGLLGDLSAEQQGFATEISSAGSHLLHLVNDILDLSKVEAGAMNLDLESVVTSSLLMNGASVIQEQAALRNIHVEIDAPDQLGIIEVDAGKAKQMLDNLLSNAVKFAIEGGRVTLRARRVPRREVSQPADDDCPGRSFPLADHAFAEFLELSVIDDGPGIAPESLGRLFLPFSQIESGLARRFDGAGLGLSIVKRLAELHGGTVAVESALNVGSCFTVWLPLREQGDAQMPGAPIARGLDAAGLTSH